MEVILINFLLLTLSILTAFVLGVLVVKYLTVHPLEMSLHLALACLSLFALVILFVLDLTRRIVVPAYLLSAIGFIFGYLFETRRFHKTEEELPLPPLTRTFSDPSRGHTAVIYFTHGEPELFDPNAWIHQFNEFDQQHIRFIPYLARPFFIDALRRKYLQVGKSGHRSMHRRMLARLEEAFRQSGDSTTRFYLSFLDDQPHPNAAAIQALNEGASRIIVCQVFLTRSNHTAEGAQLISALNLEKYDVPIVYTAPLWDSETLQRMFLERANHARGSTPREKTAILLVGHGQPAEWDQLWGDESRQEASFREAVLAQFEADGYPRSQLAQAWMEFREPRPAPAVERLAAEGVEKILYFSAAISADSIHSQMDVPELIAQAKLPADLTLANLGAWNDDPLVIQAIQERIQTAAASFETI